MRFKKLKEKIILALAVATITGTIGGNTALAAENYNLPDDVPEVKELTLEDFKAIDTFEFRGTFHSFFCQMKEREEIMLDSINI